MPVKIAFWILFLSISASVSGQTTYLPKFDCDCPQSLKYCAAAFDSVDFHKNFYYMLCADTEVFQQGVFLRPRHLTVKFPFEKTIIFKGKDSNNYEVWSRNDVLKIAVQVNTYSFELSTDGNSVTAPQHAITYTIDSMGRIDSAFTFYYPKINVSKRHEIVEKYYSDLDRAKRDSYFPFSYTKQLGLVFLAALNGDKSAKDILINFDSNIERLGKKKLLFPGTGLKEAIHIVQLQEEYGGIK